MRKPNWKAELIEFLRDLNGRKFEWGSNDCCLSTFEAVEVMTGVDLVASYRGHYTTALGSKRILKKRGHSDLCSAVSELLGEPLENPGLAGQGDVALVNSELGEALGIVFGHGVYCVGESGLFLVEFSEIQQAWRVN